MSKQQRVIRLGIIGCGNVAEQKHLPALRKVAGIRVVAAAEVDAARLDRVADRFGIEHRFSDYRAMLERADVDAVAVLTPTQHHAEMGLAALAAEKHVLIDKPLALTLAECDRLIERAVRSPGKAMVGFNLRRHPLIRRARGIIQSGALGPVKAIRSSFTHWHPGGTAQAWHKKRELGGGVVFNDATHHFDLWRFLLQSEVVQIFSVSRPSAHYEDETSVVTARLANGVLASGVFSFETSPNNELEIYGECGRLNVSCYRFDGVEFSPSSTRPGSLRDRLLKLARSIKELPQAIPFIGRGGVFDASFPLQWRYFAECIAQDKPPDCTLEDGRRAVQVVLAALDSVASGRVVTIA